MDAQRWQRIGAVFDEVADAAPDQRAALLDTLCGDDTELRADVEQLLAADRRAKLFDSNIDSARSAVAAEWVSSVEIKSWETHERIGPWRVLRELGRGGMGVVLLAERADGQFEQRAAVKLIKRGMDSDAVQARFLRERQILARLEHPHIARLLDGGLAADGRPYFAMEYVDGEPLLRYCAMLDLDLEKRIALFIDVCAAVQFAHGRLVIHRDIKPSNILITSNGEAKLLDFGIAKLLDDSHGGMTQTVEAQHRPLTPAYAAPEQIRGEPVSTATDIYSLGVVLFELLTGKRPFDLNDNADVDSARRAMDSTTTAPLPSSVVDDTTPITTRNLRGDLDTIVTTAIQRDPQRRYATVDAFAKDLQRFLGGQPISARRDSVGYRVGKFVDRHRVGVSSAVIGLVVLVAALVFALLQAQEKSRQALVSQQVTQFMVGIFRGADPSISRGANVTAQDLLDQGAKRLGSDASVVPAVRARLLHTIATTYSDLGLYDRAVPLAEQALDLRRNNPERDDADVAESLDELGRIYRLKADYARAEPLLRDALTMRRAIFPRDDPAVIESLDHFAALLRNQGNFDAADANLREALASAERRYGADATETARYLDDYASNLDDLGKRQQAIVLLRRALAVREKNLGPDDADVATTLVNLGAQLDEMGEYTDSQAALERALRIRRQIYGPEHPLVGFAELALSGDYDSQSRYDDAENLAQHALASFRRGLPADHPKIMESLNMLGILRVARRDYANAIPFMREVADRYRRTLGEDHPDTLSAENNLAYALLHDDRLDEAEALLRHVLTRDGTAQRSIIIIAHENLASTLEAKNRGADAVTEYQAAVAMVRKDEGDESGNLAVALRGLGVAYEFSGDAITAEKYLREAIDVGDKFSAKHSGKTTEWTMALIDFLGAHGRCAEAAPLLATAFEQMTPPDSVEPIFRWEAELLRGRCNRDTSGDAARAALAKIPAARKDVFPFVAQLLAGAH